MSKTNMAENIAARRDISKAEAKRMVEFVFEEIESGLKSLKKGEGKYSINGFGSFQVNKRKARKGVNPSTGEPIKIKASRSLRFRPYAGLKSAAGC